MVDHETYVTCYIDAIVGDCMNESKEQPFGEDVKSDQEQCVLEKCANQILGWRGCQTENKCNNLCLFSINVTICACFL